MTDPIPIKILTIIVPTYNMEMYLKRCLDSLLVPDYYLTKTEIIVINDGSTDDSSLIAHSYEEKYPDIFTVVDKTNANYGSCINAALPIAKGKYVKILDADDWFDNKTYIGFIDYISNCDSDLIISDYVTVDADDNIIQYYYHHIKGDTFSDITESVGMHAVTYKTKNLIDLKYKQSENISHTDLEWVFLPMSVVNSVAKFDGILYHYRIGRDGQTVDPKKFEKNFWQYISVVCNHIHCFNSLTNAFCDSNHINYLYNRIDNLVGVCYYYYFHVFHSDYNTIQLKQLDLLLKEMIPELYVKYSEQRWGEGRYLHDYRYIYHWRKHYGNRTLIIRIRDIYHVLRSKL